MRETEVPPPSRHRAYSDPSSPPLSPPQTFAAGYSSLLHQTANLSIRDTPEGHTRDHSYTRSQPRPAALTEASLAALTYSAPQDDVYHPFGTLDGYGYPRQVATPSTTSVSDEEDEGEVGEGYEVKKEDFSSGPRTWVDRKGKGKAVQVDSEDEGVASGDGIAGKLPEEVLMHIFRLLPTRHLFNTMQVSKSWCLSAYPLLWSRPPISSISQLASLVRILSQPQSALSLPYQTSIRRMNLNAVGSQLTADLFTPLKACTRIERITMVGSTKLPASALRTVIDCLPDLVAVDLANTESVDDSVLKALGKRCIRLQGLNVSGCKSVGDEGVKAIARGCRMLRRMKLAGCHRITDESIINLVRQCPLILELDIASVPQLRDTSIYAMWLHTIHLRELKLGKNDNFTSGGIPDLPLLYYEPNESIIYHSSSNWISYIERERQLSSPSSPSILVRTPSARSRALTVDSYIDRDRDRLTTTTTMATKIDIGKLRPVAPIFDFLRIVDFTGCSLLDDQALWNLVKSAPKLRNLTLAKCVMLTDGGMEAIARLGKGLHYLHLGHVEKITDAAITKIARSCTRLRYIDVACCPLLTDLSVFELSANLPKLRRIGLVKVVNLTDEGVYALAERYSSLERIHLSYCDNISVRAVTYLLNRLLKLSHLSLTGVRAFKNSEIQRFRKEIPAEFSEHQSASFCVFSYHGIIALRHYLNAKQSANTAGSDTSTNRRASGSSASSVNLNPALSHSPPRGSVWVGPAYGASAIEDEGVGRGHRWSTGVNDPWNDFYPSSSSPSPGPTGASIRPFLQLHGSHRGFYTPDRQTSASGHDFEMEDGDIRDRRRGESSTPIGSSGPRLGDQVYRRVSIPTLPVPLSNTSPAATGSGSGRRSVPRPRGPRTAETSQSQVQRIPGEWPSTASTSGAGVWGQQGLSGMLWGYGDDSGNTGSGSGTRARAGDRERTRDGERYSSRFQPELQGGRLSSSSVAPVLLGPPVGSSSAGGRHRSNTTSGSTSTLRNNVPHHSTSINQTASSHTYNTSHANHTSTPTYTSNLAAEPHSYDHSPDPPPPHSMYRESSTGTPQQTELFSTLLTQGRERSGSVTNALTDLAGRLRRPSISLGAAVGAVAAVGDVGAAPLRWVAGMVGWSGEEGVVVAGGSGSRSKVGSRSASMSREQGRRDSREGGGE